MLGEGRPFVMEMVNPKVLDVDLAAVEDEVNRRNAGRLEVRGLHWTEKSRVRAIKETPHAKEYTARVRIEGAVAPDVLAKLVGTRIQVTQQTPQRVKHRRADKARERWIEFREFARVPDAAVEAGAPEPLAATNAPATTTATATTSAPTNAPTNAPMSASTNASSWLVRIRTEHGTYVKEVINGESGGTTPSLSELVGHPCHCVELDVSAILDVEGQAEEVRPAPARFGDNV
jgi:tRNA pseudouridine synthase 10